MTFGEWVRHLRKQQPEKTSQEDLARALGVTKGYISQIETDNSSSTGLPPRVSDEHLRSLAKVLGIDEQEMFSRATSVVPSGFSIIPDDKRLINPVAMLIRETLAKFPGASQISAAEIDEISEELEDFAQVRIGRRVRHLQEAK